MPAAIGATGGPPAGGAVAGGAWLGLMLPATTPMLGTSPADAEDALDPPDAGVADGGRGSRQWRGGRVWGPRCPGRDHGELAELGDHGQPDPRALVLGGQLLPALARVELDRSVRVGVRADEDHGDQGAGRGAQRRPGLVGDADPVDVAVDVAVRRQLRRQDRLDREPDRVVPRRAGPARRKSPGAGPGCPAPACRWPPAGWCHCPLRCCQRCPSRRPWHRPAGRARRTAGSG